MQNIIHHILLDLSFDLLICNLISENQVLEKLGSVSNLRKISGPVHLAFFLDGDLEKNPGLQDLKFFCCLKQIWISEDLDFQKSRCRLKCCVVALTYVHTSKRRSKTIFSALVQGS